MWKFYMSKSQLLMFNFLLREYLLQLFIKKNIVNNIFISKIRICNKKVGYKIINLENLISKKSLLKLK